MVMVRYVVNGFRYVVVKYWHVVVDGDGDVVDRLVVVDRDGVVWPVVLLQLLVRDRWVVMMVVEREDSLAGRHHREQS